jgi:outer membrane receptor protein involved in Fe transport
MKMGLDFHQTTNSFVDLQYRTVSYSLQGRYTNDDAAELLLGLPQSVSGSTFYEGHMRQNNWGAYFQDDWKIRPNLTLNLGLRYEYITPFYGLSPSRM